MAAHDREEFVEASHRDCGTHGLPLGLPGDRSAVAGPTGFEPAISSVTGWHVGPLHHGPAEARSPEYNKGTCAAQTVILRRTRRAAAQP
jgi:hypothetical protein